MTDKHCYLSEAKTVQSCSETERLRMEKLWQSTILGIDWVLLEKMVAVYGKVKRK